VAKSLIARGVEKDKITVVVYGDTRAKQNSLNRKVEFILRKRDLRTQGKKVNAQ
jgi:outer membrane protein OmpA-like peptidoglycan-associated protein